MTVAKVGKSKIWKQGKVFAIFILVSREKADNGATGGSKERGHILAGAE